MPMSTIWSPIRNFLNRLTPKKILKYLGILALAFVTISLLICVGFSVYFDSNKAQIVKQINEQINEDCSGSVVIKDVNYAFFQGFPNMTLALSQVQVKDSLWPLHKRTLLQAERIKLRVNVLKLLGNELFIDKIEVQNANLHVFKSKNGVVNTSIFKNKKDKSQSKSTTDTAVKEIIFKNVRLISENQKGKKLFDFDVEYLKGNFTFDGYNWQSKVTIKTMANSMAFNTQRGSFVQNKIIQAVLKANYHALSKKISVKADELFIGADVFAVQAHFGIQEEEAPFDISIQTNILWRNAAAILSGNIKKRLDQFDLQKPLQVRCSIIGDLNTMGDPEIVVLARVKNDRLTIPDGIITNCSFTGQFTNNFKKGLGCNDINSAIRLTNFAGQYKTIPFRIFQGVIANFEKTIATGNFSANFKMQRLNKLIDKEILYFTGGVADVKLDFKFDVASLKIKKPQFKGRVFVKEALLNYGPKNFAFLKTNIELDFTDKALLLKNISFRNAKSAVFMEGKIDNFMTLYYDSPQKMIVNWQVYAPYLDVKQFVGAITTDNPKQAKAVAVADPFSAKLYDAIHKSQVIMDVKADKINYGKWNASRVLASVALINDSFIVQKAKLETCGGRIQVAGKLSRENKNFKVASNVKLSSINVTQFLTAMDNFGIKSFQPANIEGTLNATADVKGLMIAGGALKTETLAGNVNFKLSDGALINFKPITAVAKFAFPFRNVNNIVLSDLVGDFKINEGRVGIKKLKVSSSILNFDVNGVYSFQRGTNLAMTIPLRNPRKDTLISDEEKRLAKRYKGLVLHLLAQDVDGKIKIKWNKNHD